MAKPYVISIVNGSASEVITTGEYTVSASVLGYDNNSILPATQTITEDVSSYDFTIAATGTLTLHVSEEGIEDGTPVVGATFIRCDASGNTYGEEITSDDSGNAVFHYVPFSAGGDALTVYYKQTSSDGEHDYDLELANISLTEEQTTVEVINIPPTAKTINVTDANYSGLPIASGEITLS